MFTGQIIGYVGADARANKNGKGFNFNVSTKYKNAHNFLSTNSQLLVGKKLILCNTLIINSKFPLYKRSVCTHILLAFHMSLTDFA